ncbi:ARM repeat-containing protein [Fistulina hepatica ATCC 64428]|uniref:ARM repeat-containing protein n=1 Tax=Fistulina hepatica ATCC 64428 TaxID=1128425 RepID=A0A0D7AJI3_9AGAR|nr:ARM repeat-containing protein [Fistulina hepatica ATCC 64428]
MSPDVRKAVRYVPPHLRKANGTDPEALLRLKKQLKGLLNRMSEPNLATILDSVDEVYRSHSRHDVTSTLTSLLIEGVSSHSLLLDSYVVLHAAFISSLHKTVGAEFASYLIQHVVSSYEHAYKSTREGAAASDQVSTLSKESTSLIMLLAELYNFQVISCVLIYDIIRELLDGDITELDVELLLKVVRGAGSRLRQDDPLALKDIIQIVQQKVSEKTEAPSSRTRFMIETLTNLKNNKLKRSATQGQGGNEAVERLRKFLSALHKKRHVLSHDPLRLTLDDLRTAETRGRWWLPGAPWVGDPLAERQAECRANAKQEGSDPTQEQQDVDHALLRLAKKQGMNTDIRRSIFVVLMSSEDYVDACDRLSQLGLTEVQQREIVRVLLHCSGNEKVYNPYYALVGQHLCRTSHAPKVTIQFCLWDFLRELGESGVGGLAVLKSLEESQGLDGSDDFDTDGKISQTRVDNIARLYAWWIAKDSPLDFAMLKPSAKRFLKCLLVYVFRSVQAAGPAYDVGPSLSGGGTDAGWSGDAQRSRGAIEDVFIKATRSETLAVGLLYFIKDAFREETDGFVRWACKVACDALGTAV